MVRKPIRYSDAGVSRSRSESAKQTVARLARGTFNRHVLAEIGSFGALFHLGSKWKDPVLVSSADGVGTKVKLAAMARRNDVSGEDIVNHCVNDIAVQGATPLFFLDYIAAARLKPEELGQVFRGLARACKKNGVALIGGETAEMPGVYVPGEYDLAGFIVGAVERKKVLTGARVRPGDVLLGLASSGLHTNGYSLARKLVFEVAKKRLSSRVPGLQDSRGSKVSVADALLAPHRSYWPVMKPLLERDTCDTLRAAAHITGGGITENLPRVLPRGVRAEVDLGSWRLPPLFAWLRELGSLSDTEMLRTFNCGIGMILVVPPKHKAHVMRTAKQKRIGCIEIGVIAKSSRRARPATHAAGGTGGGEVRYTGRLV